MGLRVFHRIVLKQLCNTRQNRKGLDEESGKSRTGT